MSLKLNSSGGGSVTLQEPTTASNVTLNLPAADGTVNTSGAVNEVPAGSASAPSIYPTGDTNTGIFFPAADTIAFTEGGVESARIDSSGRFMVGSASSSSAGIKIGNQYGGVSLDGGGGTYAQWGGAYGIYPRATVGLGIGSAVAISFDVNGGTEAARIDSSGNLLVGTATPASGGAARFYILADGNAVDPMCVANSNSGSSSQYAIVFRRNTSTVVGSIQTTNAATSYNTSSDYRLKHDIAPMQNALATVAQLKPVTYKWNVDDSESQGFIAHELQAVVPECVTGEKDAVDADGNPVYQGIDTSFLVATLTAGLQEAVAMIEELKAKVAALEAQ
jgi:hypothetical protein